MSGGMYGGSGSIVPVVSVRIDCEDGSSGIVEMASFDSTIAQVKLAISRSGAFGWPVGQQRLIFRDEVRALSLPHAEPRPSGKPFLIWCDRLPRTRGG